VKCISQMFKSTCWFWVSALIKNIVLYYDMMLLVTIHIFITLGLLEPSNMLDDDLNCYSKYTYNLISNV